MKTIKYLAVFIATSVALCSCKDDTATKVVVSPIGISSPEPTETISGVELSESQKPFVAAGNEFAVKCLKALFDDENMIFSPLSLQYAFALAANGASGETAAEIVQTLGFGEDKAALNAYCNLLLNQLPALDKDVVVKLANAVIMNDMYKAQESFRQIAETVYYSPVEYASLSNPKVLVDRINEWASRNTAGLINPFIDESDISEYFAAAILNALYFKAKWKEYDMLPTFVAGTDSAPFYFDGGGNCNVKYMFADRIFRHGKLYDNTILELPYGNDKYVMYVILPDTKGVNRVEDMLSALTAEKLTAAINSMSSKALVHVQMPMFETASRFDLTAVLKSLGINRAFERYIAEFDSLIEDYGTGDFRIGSVIQKSKIKVTDWGTEAAAVTMVEIYAESAPSEEQIYFTANHPFVYLIAEKASGLILFEGIYNGK